MDTAIRLARASFLLLAASLGVRATPLSVGYYCTPFTPQFSMGSSLRVSGDLVCPTFDSRLGPLVSTDGISSPVFVMVSLGLADSDGTITLRNNGNLNFSGCYRGEALGHVCAFAFGVATTLGPLPGQPGQPARTVWSGIEAFGQGRLAPEETRTLTAFPLFYASATLVPDASLAPFVTADGSGRFVIPVQIDLEAIEIPSVEVTGYSFRRGVDWALVVYTYETPEPGTWSMILVAAAGAVLSRRRLNRAG